MAMTNVYREAAFGSRLYLLEKLNPDPTGGTVNIERPSTKLRNTLDDINRKFSTYAILFDSIRLPTRICFFNDIEIQSAKAFYSYNSSLPGFVFFSRCPIDYENQQTLFGMSASGWGRAYQIGGPDNWLRIDSSCIRQSAAGSNSNPIYAGGANSITLLYTFLYRTDEESTILNCELLSVYRSVFDASADSTYGTFRLSGTKRVIFPTTFNGKRNTIKNTPGPGMTVEDRTNLDGQSIDLTFTSCTGECISVASASIDIRATDSPVGLLDGGGNSDVGIDIIDGSHSSVVLDANTDVTGTNGDVRMQDDTVISYVDIAAATLASDFHFNKVTKAT